MNQSRIEVICISIAREENSNEPRWCKTVYVDRREIKDIIGASTLRQEEHVEAGRRMLRQDDVLASRSLLWSRKHSKDCREKEEVKKWTKVSIVLKL